MYWTSQQLGPRQWRILPIASDWDVSMGYRDVETEPAELFVSEEDAQAECEQRNYREEFNGYCEACGKPMAFTKPGPRDIDAATGRTFVEFESAIFTCRDHGLWRIFISGARVPYRGLLA